MKIKPGIRPWLPETRPPILPPINIIFEMKNKEMFSDDALLYQGILKYCIEYDNGKEVRFTEMGNFLIKTLPEFVNAYSGSKAKTPKNVKLANRRNRIEERINILLMMELVRIKEMVPGRKNEKERVPLYELTRAGQFLAWIIEAKDPEKAHDPMWPIKLKARDHMEQKKSATDQERSRRITKVFEIVKEYTNLKESFILKFLSAFFKKCFDKGLFGEIVDFYYYYELKYIEVNKGQEILRLFIKINHLLHWIFAQPNIFMETLNDMDDETKKVLKFNFKMDIEEYYNKYYLISYIRRYAYSAYHHPDLYYSGDMAIPGKDWQLTRLNNVGNEGVVIIPAFCSDCRSEIPITMDISKYLNHLLTFVSGSMSFEIIISNCSKCKKDETVFGKIYMPLDMFRGHEAI
jgi:hypothetical protein